MIVDGYWVFKVGSNDISFEEIMGRYDFSIMNENVDVFVNLCVNKYLDIGRIIFLYKFI